MTIPVAHTLASSEPAPEKHEQSPGKFETLLFFLCLVTCFLCLLTLRNMSRVLARLDAFEERWEEDLEEDSDDEGGPAAEGPVAPV